MSAAPTSVGERFARSLLAKDWDGVAAVLHPDVSFRGLTPGRSWEASSASGLVADVLGAWFEPTDDVYEILGVTNDRVVDRERVVYRARVRNDDGDFVCEQTAYYDAVDNRISTLRILCSGFIPAQGRTGS